CSHKPKMSQAQVVQVANTAATAQGFILSEYGTPNARFEFPDRDWTWMVMYDLKLQTPWGPRLPAPQSAHGAPQHFFVTVDDRTGTTKLGMLKEAGAAQTIKPPAGATILGYTNMGRTEANSK